MKTIFAYFTLVLFLALGAKDGVAQLCERNMLHIPDASSYAVIPNPKGIILPGAFTIEFWAQSASFAGHSGLIEQLHKGDTGSFSIGFTSGDSISVSLKLNNGVVSVVTSNIPNLQNWQHYAVTFTPNDSIRIYVGGVLLASKKTTGLSLVASSDTILIAHSTLSGITFTGNMDELRIWNVAKSQAQILASMNIAITGTEAGLKAYYSFDDDPATPVIHDFSGGKNDGRIVSNAIVAANTSPVKGPASPGYMIASKESKLVFPDLICDSQAVESIHVFNRGPEELQVDPVAIQLGTVFSVTATGFPLPPDSSHLGTIRIQANPKKPGIYRDTLIVPSNTICGGILRIPVELRYDKIAMTFEDSIFNLYSKLPCELPLQSQTHLQNIGTKAVTINSLRFTPPSGITILSPKIPFTIDSGKSQEVRFSLDAGNQGKIKSTLVATSVECSQIAKIEFRGDRVVPNFIVSSVSGLPSIHLPANSVSVFDTIMIKNIGTSELFNALPLSLQGAAGYSMIAPPSGLAHLLPDSSVKIILHFSTAECGVYETSIHIQDPQHCSIDTLIPISITVLGPDISPSQKTIDFGASCGPHDTTITFVNRSGRTVLLGNPIFSHDSIFSIKNSPLPKVLVAGDSISITLRFAPSEPGAYDADAGFRILSPCGDSYLHLSGILGVGKIGLSNPNINFGNGCDLQPTTRKLSVTNLCKRQITVSNVITEGSQRFKVIKPSLPCMILNNETKEIEVEFDPVQLGLVEKARINLYENGCFITRFTTRGVREHAHVEWSPPLAGFGTVCPGRSNTMTIGLQNFGDGDDTVASYRFITKSAFNVENISNFVVPNSGSTPIQLSFTPTGIGDFVGLLQVILSPCGDTTEIAMHGIGGPPAELSVVDSTIDFGTIKLGSRDSSHCLIIQNPSCLGLSFSIDSIHDMAPPFSLTNASVNKLPGIIDNTDPLILCFVFAPDKNGTFSQLDTLRIGNLRKIITLTGKCGLGDLKFIPKSIDFGDVLIGTPKILPLGIRNVGAYQASLATQKQPTPDFSHSLANTLTLEGLSSFTDNITFKPAKLGLQSSSIIFIWSGKLDTVQLRGHGIQPGLQFSSSLLDFSKVRIADTLILDVEVTNTLSTQITITSFSIENANGKFYFTSPTGNAFIKSGETKHYPIGYTPNLEISDTATLILTTENSDVAKLPMRGQGVQAHLVISTTKIDFGDVGLLKSAPAFFSISNTGGYKLVITDVGNSVPEFKAIGGSTVTVSPGSTINYPLTFTPLRAMTYFDSLFVNADAPEKFGSILLRGNGVFEPSGIPQVSYTIPSTQAKVGDVIDIPIRIGGKDLSLFDLRDFHVELSYDPTVVFFHDTIDTVMSLSSGYSMKFERLAHDSIIRISGSGKSIIAQPGVFFSLQAEALLGPLDSTRIFILNSDPQNTSSKLASSGEFVVTDCGNYRGGIFFKGNYSVSSIKPNPTAYATQLDYELGLAGRVRIDLYDALGRMRKTVLDEDQTKGNHSAIISVDGIPSGEYIYVLRSLEFEHRGTLIVHK